MKISRRSALRGASALGVAAVMGCEHGTSTPLDSGPGDLDGSVDAGRVGRDSGPAPTGPFRHGVASGDPLPEAVILWTRVSVEDAPSEIELAWEMSISPDFAAIAAMGMVNATESRDYTAKIDATGLMPNTTYYYRFRVSDTGEESPIGRTRTAPASDAADVERLRFAVCSCASMAHGWFHGYRNIAARRDLSAVLHLGDYIYEYGNGQFGGTREYDPPHEVTTLDDYRRRYRHYRSDPDLQEVHRQHPFITVWDDHEFANNSFRDGAGNHQPTEGAWADRKRVAQQAYSEYMPIRADDPAQIWRSLRYGNLAELIMLDTRIDGRTLQGMGAPETRTLISGVQEEFLLEALESDAQWKVVGQQVIFSPFPIFSNDDQWDGYPASRARILEAIRHGGVEGAAIQDVVFLTGDIHTSWAMEVIEDPEADLLPAATAVEFVTPGITSPGLTTPGSPLERTLDRVLADHPHIKYGDIARRGYIVLDLSRVRAQASFVHIDDIQEPYDPSERVSRAWETASGESRLVEATSAEPPADAPPLAP